MNGTFIVVDGPDGSGKTTLVAELTRLFVESGVDVVTVREPGGTPAAEWARKGAFDPELRTTPVAELFFILAARADLVSKIIRPSLEEGKVVLSDRFELSTFAYQVAGRGLSEETVRQSNTLATGGLTPQLTIVLDVSPEVGRDRQNTQGKELDRMERESMELHNVVAEAFRTASGPDVVHVDANHGPRELVDAVWGVIVARVGDRVGVSLGEPR